MGTVRLSSKNQIVLPKEAREAMMVKSHDELLVVVKGDVTVIMPKPKRYHAALAGTAKGVYRKAHLKTERSSW